MGDILDPQEAARKAWGMLAEACDRALVVRGLDDEDTADLREIRQAAAGVAGIPPARAVGPPSTEPKGAA